MEVTLNAEQINEIATKAAKMIVDHVDFIRKIQTELVAEMQALYTKHPELKGRHKELGEIVTRLETANPALSIGQLLDAASREMLRNAD